MKKDPVRSRLQIDMPKSLRDELKSLAYKRGMTLTEYVLNAIAEYSKDKNVESQIKTELDK